MRSRPRFTRSVAVLVLVIAVAFVGCAGKSLVASGRTLKSIGDQFTTTASLYNQLYESGRVSAEDYRAWAKFAKQFKVVYPQLVQSWTTLAASPDTADPQVVSQLIQQLSDQLFTYYMLVGGR